MDNHDRHEEGIFVAIRVRPLNERELAEKQTVAWNINSQSTTIAQIGEARSIDTNAWTFDHVFGENASHLELYNRAAQHVVKSSVEGVNGTVFAYGQTSSGKTYTMKGITDKALDEIFSIVESNVASRTYTITCSYMEIYNEEINDLLKPTNRNLKVHEDLQRGIFVGNLTAVPVTNREDTVKLIQRGEQNRKVGSTRMNEKSSRSHSILRLNISSCPHETGADNNDVGSNNGSGARLTATLNLVDLAGSERQAHTQSKGERLKEGSHINKSLMSLGIVMRQLAENGGRGHVPYRNSSLTRILQPALGGNSRTSVVCCVTQASYHVEETISTLGFASRAKNVKNKVTVNEVMDDQATIRQLRQELAMLKRKHRDFCSTPSPTNDIVPNNVHRKRAKVEKKRGRSRSLSMSFTPLNNASTPAALDLPALPECEEEHGNTTEYQALIDSVNSYEVQIQSMEMQAVKSQQQIATLTEKHEACESTLSELRQQLQHERASATNWRQQVNTLSTQLQRAHDLTNLYKEEHFVTLGGLADEHDALLYDREQTIQQLECRLAEAIETSYTYNQNYDGLKATMKECEQERCVLTNELTQAHENLFTLAKQLEDTRNAAAHMNIIRVCAERQELNSNEEHHRMTQEIREIRSLWQQDVQRLTHTQSNLEQVNAQVCHALDSAHLIGEVQEIDIIETNATAEEGRIRNQDMACHVVTNLQHLFTKFSHATNRVRELEAQLEDERAQRHLMEEANRRTISTTLDASCQTSMADQHNYHELSMIEEVSETEIQSLESLVESLTRTVSEQQAKIESLTEQANREPLQDITFNLSRYKARVAEMVSKAATVDNDDANVVDSVGADGDESGAIVDELYSRIDEMAKAAEAQTQQYHELQNQCLSLQRQVVANNENERQELEKYKMRVTRLTSKLSEFRSTEKRMKTEMSRLQNKLKVTETKLSESNEENLRLQREAEEPLSKSSFSQKKLMKLIKVTRQYAQSKKKVHGGQENPQQDNTDDCAKPLSNRPPLGSLVNRP